MGTSACSESLAISVCRDNCLDLVEISHQVWESKRMQWITDEDLKTWAKRTDARELFVDLVGDLIRATVADITKFRFPGQSAGTLRGFDGDLEVAGTAAASRVPAGPSKWEFGTTPAGKAKAESDYNKRTEKTPAEIMAKNAFVMLNLHNWDTPRETLVAWEAEKNFEEKWREVHFMDGTVLQKWLEEKPAVAARYARTVLDKAPRNGALSTDEFWERFSAGFKPTLTEAVLLAGREGEARQLIEFLAGGPQNFTIAAESAEEVMAFAVAAIRTAPDEVRRLLEAKTMIVETAEAAQFLHGMKDMVYLVWRGAEAHAASLGQRGATLTAATGMQRKRQGLMQLNRPSASVMAEAMGSMNIERQAAYELAHKCGRSLVILRRLNPAAGIDAPAEWAGQAKALKPALLAGGWTADSQLDREVVASLGGSADYLAVEKPVRETLGMSDPPFDKVEQVWQVRAAVDAFPYYGHLVDEEDLVRLKAAVVKVLSHHVVQPTAEEKFSLNYRAPADYSSWLRDGLAYTLNLFAVMPEVGGLEFSGTTPQRYVDDVIRSLPEYAKSHRWILPILPQLSVLAEAAPIPFLEALEKSLEGANNDALNLFQEPEGNDFLFRETSPHVYVLWALELLAWDPVLLPRVTLVLGKLTRIDPKAKSNNGNRPLSSLRSIFLAWSPSTDADLSKRIKALDGLIRSLPDVSWELLLALAPQHHDTTTPTARPKLRDTTPLNPERITFGLVWETEAKILERSLELAKGSDDRLLQLAEHLASYQQPGREQLLKVFEESLAGPSPTEGKPLWHRLRDLASHHAAFPDSDWSLKGPELEKLMMLVEKHRPTDPIAQTRHLFDDWIPRVGADAETEYEDAEEARTQALQQIYRAFGIGGLLRLAMTVKLPRQMGQAFDKLELKFEEAGSLIFELIAAGGECFDLACLVSGAQRRRSPEAWATYFEESVLPRTSSLEEAAWLLSAWQSGQETWRVVDQLGKSFAEAYWRVVGSLPYSASEEDWTFAIERLRKVGRSLKVITSLHQRVKEVPSQMLVELLDESVEEIASGGSSTMLAYAVGEVFQTLSARNDLPAVDVARREYIYLPLIEGSVKGLAVHKLLASDPAEYVAILSNVYAAKNSEPIENPSEGMRTRARMSYRLLKSFHTLPGDRGDCFVDEVALREWVMQVRALAKESDRAEIADEFIGQLIAHSKPDAESGAWPQAAIANLLDELLADGLERGIEVERFNMRGAFSRGIQEGGGQERELAATYRRWAEKTASPRTEAMLERIAQGWDSAARREDIRAEQEMLKR